MTGLTDPSSWFCHYTRAETAFTHIMPTGELLMNPYSKMRDPFENKRPMFRSAGSWGDVDSKSQERLFWAVQAEVGRSRDAWFLLSLTQGDDRPADNHAGACLIFDRPALLDALHHHLGARGSYWEGAVDYTPAGFAVSQAGAITLDQFHESSLEDDVAHHVVRHHRDFFFLKTEDWASEHEYRFVFKRADREQAVAEFLPTEHLVRYGRALRYVVVGEKFPAWQVPGAREVAERADVELRQMKWDHARPFPAKSTWRQPRDPGRPQPPGRQVRSAT
jgi:hypothetical protein